MKLREILTLSWLPVIIASLCCLAPIILVLFGLSSLTFAISLTNILDGQYRWAFIFAGLITLIISLVIYFRKRGVCTLDQAKKHRNEIINKVLLVLIISVVAYLLFFYVILGFVGQTLHLWWPRWILFRTAFSVAR